jgi:ferric enterobactin receptor
MHGKWILALFTLFPLATRAADLQAAPWGGDTLFITESFEATPLKFVFRVLEEKYHLKLAYDEAVASRVRVSCRLERQGLEAAFTQLLAGTGLSFRLVDQRHIMIREIPYEAPPPPALLSLRGRVVDALSGEPLPYAAVLLNEGGAGVAADEQGSFVVEAPAGALVLDVRYIGYHRRLSRVEPGAGAGELLVGLYPKVQEFAPITVIEPRPILRVDGKDGHYAADARLWRRLSAFPGGVDLFRALQLLPGLSAHDDLSAGLQIRGSAPEGNLIILDGITLYQVDHFFGIFSAINPNVIGQVDLYKNAFPAQYGGRTAGVLVMNSRPVGGSRPSGGLELNLLNSNAHLALPLGDKVDLLLGARASNGNVSRNQFFEKANQPPPIGGQFVDPFSNLSRRILVGLEPDFRFNDANARLNWRPRPRSNLALSYFRGRDRYQGDYEERFFNRVGLLRVENREVYRESASWTNAGASLRWEERWREQFRSSISLSRSAFQNDNRQEAALYRLTRFRSDTFNVRNHNINAIDSWEARLHNVWSPDQSLELAAGYEYATHRVNYNLAIDGDTLLGGRDQAWSQVLYAQFSSNFSQYWRLSAGLRGSFYSELNRAFLSPRLQLGYRLGERWRANASASRYFQFLRQLDYEDRFGRSQPFWALASDSGFPIAASNHFSLGLGYHHAAFSAEAELFLRHTSGVMEYALLRRRLSLEDPRPFRNREYRAFAGDNAAVGIELLLRKAQGKHTGWIAYTLSKSTNRFPDIRSGEPFPAGDDRRHQLKVVNQYRWGDWQFSANYVFANGRPYSDLATWLRLRNDADRRDISFDERILRLDDYHRVDLAVNYLVPLGKLQGNLGLSVFNLLNRDNVKYRQYIYAFPEGAINQQPRATVTGSEVELLNRTFNLSFRLDF